MTLARIEPAANKPGTIGDQSGREAVNAERRALLETCGEFLARVGRFALEHFVLFDWQVRVLELRLPDGRAERAKVDEVLGIVSLDESGLQPAAVAVLEAVQNRLEAGAEQLHPMAAGELERWRRKALAALIQVEGNKRAKEIVLEISGGEPLAVCIGPPKQRMTATVAFGTISARPKGCYSVFRDTTRTTGGVMWPYRCPSCRKRNGHRNPEREHDKQLRDRLEALVRSPRIVVGRASEEAKRRGYIGA